MRQRLAFLLKYYLFWMAFFVVGKMVFLGWFGAETAQLPFATTLGIVWHGLRMDAAASAYVVAIPFMLMTFAIERTWRWIRRVVLWWTVIFVVFIAGLTMGDLELYKEWGFRIDATTARVDWTPAAAGMAAVCLNAQGPCGSFEYRFVVDVAPTRPPMPVARLTLVPPTVDLGNLLTADGQASSSPWYCCQGR